jgi:hypothetical protein
MLALPTVVIGLLVYSLLSRRGVFGSLGWLYTQKAMIFGQIILITPIIIAFTIAAVGSHRRPLPAHRPDPGRINLAGALVILREARFSIMAAIVAAFGRVISEIGISMMLGGNAKGFHPDHDHGHGPGIRQGRIRARPGAGHRAAGHQSGRERASGLCAGEDAAMSLFDLNGVRVVHEGRVVLDLPGTRHRGEHSPIPCKGPTVPENRPCLASSPF